MARIAEPTALRVLKGETRPSRININEAVPAKNEPVPPEWFTDEVLDVWDRVVPELRFMGLLSAADTDALAVYCQTVVHYQKAVDLVNSSGLMVLGRDGNVVKNPAVAMVREFGAQVRHMAHEFGLTPSARVGLATNESVNRGEGAERYLSG